MKQNLVTEIQQQLRSRNIRRLLLAVSGGLDSICLAHYFIQNHKLFGLEWLGIAHVHHGLREFTADRDANFVKKIAEQYSIPFFLKLLNGSSLTAEGSIEENARNARYKALKDIAIDIGPSNLAIVTAHHADDQSETMFMRLRRGTTLAGLRGIQVVRPMNIENFSSPQKRYRDPIKKLPNDAFFIDIFRPFLKVSRAELFAYAQEQKLCWCEDESNSDVKFTRNKIRHEWLPQLENNCPGAISQLCRIAEIADKAYGKVIAQCDELFSPTILQKTFPQTSFYPHFQTYDGTNDNANAKIEFSPPKYIAFDKKKLHRIFIEHKNADLSETFRLWLSELGFRLPIGFFYAKSEAAHVKIPVRSAYRKRSITKTRHTVWICEFEDALTATNFVSCEMKEKD